MQVRAWTATHWPFWQAVPGPQAGVQASGTQLPFTQTFPAPQKSEQVSCGVEEVQAERASVSIAAARVSLPVFKMEFPFPTGSVDEAAPRRPVGEGP